MCLCVLKHSQLKITERPRDSFCGTKNLLNTHTLVPFARTLFDLGCLIHIYIYLYTFIQFIFGIDIFLGIFFSSSFSSVIRFDVYLFAYIFLFSSLHVTVLWVAHDMNLKILKKKYANILAHSSL